MSEELPPYWVPNRKLDPRRPPKPGEKLFEFLDGHDRYLCELRDHGDPFGVEAQFYRNEEFLYSRRFDTRALAVQWANVERTAIKKGGDVMGDNEMSDADDDWVIWSYEHHGWWRPGRWGYTERLDEAGHYSQLEADAIVAHANIVAVNEVALPFTSVRFHVVPEHDRHGGPGWTIFDRNQQRMTGGWFADRIAAEKTAAVLNGPTRKAARDGLQG